jgi:hypothetical protein
MAIVRPKTPSNQGFSVKSFTIGAVAIAGARSSWILLEHFQ